MTTTYLFDSWPIYACCPLKFCLPMKPRSLPQRAGKYVTPLSYADAFAAAAAEGYKAILLTGDPELLALADKLQIETLRDGL